MWNCIFSSSDILLRMGKSGSLGEVPDSHGGEPNCRLLASCLRTSGPQPASSSVKWDGSSLSYAEAPSPRFWRGAAIHSLLRPLITLAWFPLPLRAGGSQQVAACHFGLNQSRGGQLSDGEWPPQVSRGNRAEVTFASLALLGKPRKRQQQLAAAGVRKC